MLNRHLAILLHRAAQVGEPFLLQGPRGAGKTALLRKELPEHAYADLSDMGAREGARSDPAAFLARFRGPAIVDEFWRAPELVAHLADHVPALPLVFVTSVRVNVPLPALELHPPTRAEREGRPPMPIEVLGRFVPAGRAPVEASPGFGGGKEFLYRDLPLLVQVEDRDRLERFVDLLTQRSGQLLHQQDLAREIGVSHRTVVRWLAALDACFLTLRLEPYHADFGRRLVMRPKLHVLGGANFETAVVTEIYRNARHTGAEVTFSYWRDSNGLEAPFILEHDGGTVPVGIAAAPSPAEESRLQRWMDLAGLPQGALIGREVPRLERRSTRVLRYGIGQL